MAVKKAGVTGMIARAPTDWPNWHVGAAFFPQGGAVVSLWEPGRMTPSLLQAPPGTWMALATETRVVYTLLLKVEGQAQTAPGGKTMWALKSSVSTAEDTDTDPELLTALGDMIPLAVVQSGLLSSSP